MKAIPDEDFIGGVGSEAEYGSDEQIIISPTLGRTGLEIPGAIWVAAAIAFLFLITKGNKRR